MKMWQREVQSISPTEICVDIKCLHILWCSRMPFNHKNSLNIVVQLCTRMGRMDGVRNSVKLKESKIFESIIVLVACNIHRAG